MKRAAAVALGILLLAWLSCAVYPGHTYLAGPSQLYLPILERLAAPGFLSRDLVAIYPNVTYTAYDEITLLLRDLGKVDFRIALEAQLLLFRLAAVIGAFLMARAAGLKDLPAFVAAAVVNAGTFLPGLHQPLFDPEPVPGAFAFCSTLLTAGLLAREKPLLAGVCGGVALLYDPVVAAPFWIVMLLAFVFDRTLRKLLRPMLPILLVFVLLLANLAQLQPGAADADAGSVFGKLPQQVIEILRFRLPTLWISLWTSPQIHLYLLLFVLDLWAVARIWPALNRQAKWIFTALPASGILSLLLSALLLDHLHLSFIAQVQPARALLFTVAFTWLACAIAGLRALGHRRKAEAVAWLSVCAAVLAMGLLRRPAPPVVRSLPQLASWAESNTWGGSMFLFPDAGRALDPSAFRAESRRALWVDWESGAQTRYYPELARLWWERWKDTMQNPLSDRLLQHLLTLPVDYFVFHREHPLAFETAAGYRYIKPVFSNADFLVYDAADLRFKPGRLHCLTTR